MISERFMQVVSHHLSPVTRHLFRLFVTCVLAATATKLLKLKPVGRGFLVLCRYVVPTLAVSTLKHNVIARHNSTPFFACRFLDFSSGNWQS